MLIENVEIIYSAIYEPHSPEPGVIPEKFFIGCKVDDKRAEALYIRGLYASERSGLFNFKSRFRPRVSIRGTAQLQRYETLSNALQIAEARNIGKNRLFKNIMADCEIDFYEYEHDGIKKVGATIIEIFIDPSDLLFAAMGERA